MPDKNTDLQTQNTDDKSFLCACGSSTFSRRLSCSFSRLWRIFSSRNKEFYRDRAAFGWNILFPFLIILGFGLIFSDNGRGDYKIGYRAGDPAAFASNEHAKNFLSTRHVEFVRFSETDVAFDRLRHHKIDMFVDFGLSRYWISDSSPKGYIAEKLLLASESQALYFTKEVVKLREIPYVEWVFPGILAMNIMFSALFGVGYVVVRYRKNGVLKRMSVTPVHPWEFLTAQVLSRLFVIIVTSAIVYAGCAAIYGFECKGSYVLLSGIFILGSFCMISLGLLVACRSESEEFANGLLNVLSWPMMFLSGVWFSLEGTRAWIQNLSLVFPLTHMVDAARKVMNDGATLSDIKVEMLTLAAMSVIFLTVGSIFFKWRKD
jgi:ABC-2 type transport system permease protein